MFGFLKTARFVVGIMYTGIAEQAVNTDQGTKAQRGLIRRGVHRRRRSWTILINLMEKKNPHASILALWPRLSFPHK